MDIYGKGKQETQLLQLIKDNHAEQFIQLKGHQDMSSLYKEYEAYISASTSEGFGLTLMEAVGSGLAMMSLMVIKLLLSQIIMVFLFLMMLKIVASKI